MVLAAVVKIVAAAGKVVTLSGGSIGHGQQKARLQLVEAKIVATGGQGRGRSGQHQGHSIVAGNRWVTVVANEVVAKILAMIEVLVKAGKVLVAAVVARDVMTKAMVGQVCGHACGPGYGEGCSKQWTISLPSGLPTGHTALGLLTA